MIDCASMGMGHSSRHMVVVVCETTSIRLFARNAVRLASVIVPMLLPFSMTCFMIVPLCVLCLWLIETGPQACPINYPSPYPTPWIRRHATHVAACIW